MNKNVHFDSRVPSQRRAGSLGALPVINSLARLPAQTEATPALEKLDTAQAQARHAYKVIHGKTDSY